MKHNSSIELDKLVKLIESLHQYDYSVSLPELGSLFMRPVINGNLSPLHESMQWIAEQHGVAVAFPSTSGTTPLNNLMVMTLTSPGETILIQRDSHLSLLSPAINVGLNVKYITPRYSENLGISLGIAPKDLDDMLEDNPEISVVILTYPNYFGIATDIVECARVVRKHNKVLAIDSAHGAYFNYHPDLPVPAEASGAAITTQSNHKVCATLSQGSLAFIQPSELLPNLIERFYQVVNQGGFITTSFSYPILASLIIGEVHLAEQGHANLSEAIASANYLRDRINNKLYPMRCLEFEQQPGFHSFDPLRVTVDVAELGRTGFNVADELIGTYSIYPEMETLDKVLFLFSPYDDLDRMDRIFKALCDIAQKPLDGRVKPLRAPSLLPETVMSLRDVFYTHESSKLCVPISEAVGSVSAETIGAYPPGSAIIIAGERITSDAIEFLCQTRQAGGVLKGASDSTFKFINIIQS